MWKTVWVADPEERIAVGDDPASALAQLQAMAGLVTDITLSDDTRVSAVLIGVSSSALILDSWDDVRHRPSGDPFVLNIEEVKCLVFP